MPRSGTTLVEGMLAAHSKVFGGGERPLLPQIHDAALAYSSSHDHGLPAAVTLEEWAGAYLSDLPDIGAATHITDKNPLNFEALGLVEVLFPNAAVIHIRRDPVETCFSIFKHRFSKFWSFAHSLQDIAHFYGQYTRLASHWEKTLGDRFMTVQYETLASDFSGQAPGIVKHCGLEWEPGCLEFQSQKRAVATLSAVQIRESVQLRKGVAENYRQFLGPLLDGFQ
jgi:hypothetical protein